MELRDKSIEELQERLSAIGIEAETEDADLNALHEEARSINDEMNRRADEEAKKAELRQMVADNKTEEPVKVLEESPKEERQTMNIMELRASKEYGQAFLDAWRSGDKNYSECRALLTTNTTGDGLTGYVPVPVALESEIKTAWEEHQLMNLLTKSSFKGNVKIGFELSATGASIHVEGTDAPDEEVITLGAVEIKADMIKKWIRVSDEALKGTTVDTAGYIYKELAHRIVEKAEEVIVGKITGSPAAATATAVGVPTYGVATIAADTIVQAIALLGGGAKNLHIVMNRATYAAFRSVELGGQYGFDAFEGLRDRIIFTDKLPAFGSASTGDAFAIVGDFSAVQANFPNGNGVEILVDPYTDAEADLVKIVGKQYVGIGVVGDKALCVLKKAAANG